MIGHLGRPVQPRPATGHHLDQHPRVLRHQLDLLRGGALARALINIGVSVILCLGAVALGHAVAAHLNGGQRQVAQNIIEEDAS
jgi:hypothetical protein